MISSLKALVPERIKGPVLARTRPPRDPAYERLRGTRKVVVGLAGFYQNLGDMALTLAQVRFLRETLPDHEVITVPSTETYLRMRALKAVIEPGDVITTIAGGNMDDVYPSLENCRRFFVRSFPDNPVISFPQTFAFTDSPSGRRALRHSARTYGHHRDLTIFGREPHSLVLMRRAFPRNRVEYCPDIVLSLQLHNPGRTRSGALVCMREDLEAGMSRAQKELVLGTVRAHEEDVLVRDTVDVALEDCTPATYEQALESFWDLLRTRRVVVTDRLHCMIFCVLTQTPCVVLPNSNHKITGTYDAWLREVPYVRHLAQPDPAAVTAALAELGALDPALVRSPDLAEHFAPLRDALLRAASRP